MTTRARRTVEVGEILRSPGFRTALEVAAVAALFLLAAMLLIRVQRPDPGFTLLPQTDRETSTTPAENGEPPRFGFGASDPAASFDDGDRGRLQPDPAAAPPSSGLSAGARSGAGSATTATTRSPTTAAPTTAPSTTAPSTTAPSTTAPSTAAPSTTAPSTTAPSTSSPSTTAPTSSTGVASTAETPTTTEPSVVTAPSVTSATTSTTT